MSTGLDAETNAAQGNAGRRRKRGKRAEFPIFAFFFNMLFIRPCMIHITYTTHNIHLVITQCHWICFCCMIVRIHAHDAHFPRPLRILSPTLECTQHTHNMQSLQYIRHHSFLSSKTSMWSGKWLQIWQLQSKIWSVRIRKHLKKGIWNLNEKRGGEGGRGRVAQKETETSRKQSFPQKVILTFLSKVIYNITAWSRNKCALHACFPCGAFASGAHPQSKIALLYRTRGYCADSPLHASRTFANVISRRGRSIAHSAARSLVLGKRQWETSNVRRFSNLSARRSTVS